MRKTKTTITPIEIALRKAAGKVLPPSPTIYQQVGQYELLNERPEGMSMETYRQLRRQQTKLLRDAKKASR